jgi:hypothetical protein
MATTSEEAAKPEAFDWDAATARERDCWVAEKVMGWRQVSIPPVEHAFAKCEGREPDPGPWRVMPGYDPITALKSVPEYTTDPAADYEVLKRVRETWEDTSDFHHALSEIWGFRHFRTKHMLWVNPLLYEPGDWAHAAYLALSPPAP